jgi:hypothetical protein
MSYASLMVCCDPNPRNDNRLHIAASLAERFDARVIGIAAQAELIPLYVEEGAPFTDVDMCRTNIAKRLELVEERFRDALKGRARQIEWRSAIAEPVSFIAEECRAADLVIVWQAPRPHLARSCRSRHAGRTPAADDSKRGRGFEGRTDPHCLEGHV